MKIEGLGAFQKLLEGCLSKPPLLLWIVSPDKILASWWMERVKRLHIGLWGETLDLVQVSSDSKMLEGKWLEPSLFTKKRLILAQDLLLNQPLLKKILSSPIEGIYLVGAISKGEGASAFLKEVETKGVVVYLSSMKPWEKEAFFREYISKRAQKEGIQIVSDAIRALVIRSQVDPFLIETNYEKLALWKHGEKKITLDDLRVLGPLDEEGTFFALSDALLAKRSAQGQKILASLSHEQMAPLVFLKTFRGQCILLLEIRNALRGQLPMEEVTSRYPYLRGTILEQKVQLAKLHPSNYLKDRILKVDELERLFKHTSLNDGVFLELAVSSLS